MDHFVPFYWNSEFTKMQQPEANKTWITDQKFIYISRQHYTARNQEIEIIGLWSVDKPRLRGFQWTRAFHFQNWPISGHTFTPRVSRQVQCLCLIYQPLLVPHTFLFQLPVYVYCRRYTVLSSLGTFIFFKWITIIDNWTWDFMKSLMLLVLKIHQWGELWEQRELSHLCKNPSAGTLL